MTSKATQGGASAPSIIEAMHAQWEIANEAFNINDEEHLKPSKIGAHQLFRNRAMSATEAEEDSLQLAILYQVPTSGRDATILQFHIHALVGSYGSDSPISEKDHAALEAAGGALLVYMAGEHIEEGSAGPGFQRGLDWNRTNVYFRTARREAS